MNLLIEKGLMFGNLIRVDRHFPNNTHGLLITNFFENSLKKLTDATR
ncbi:MAG: hypothetical protein NWP79_06055 [Paracoccaceae bacterium]|nr:hypothetical protein [Paracoccaceae bacterium]